MVKKDPILSTYILSMYKYMVENAFTVFKVDPNVWVKNNQFLMWSTDIAAGVGFGHHVLNM